MKKTLLATTAAVLAAGSAAAVDVELYGQVNKGVFGFDDGRNTEFVVGDNSYESTRFGLKGAQALDNGLTASVLLEGEMVDNASNSFIQQANAAGTTGSTPLNSANGVFTSRQARVGLSGVFGGLYVGKQSTASDGSYLQDLAGASDVMGANFNEIGGGIGLRNRTTGGLAGMAAGGAVGTVGVGGVANAITVNNKTSQFDRNRANSVRYDSPIYGGIQGRASMAQGGDLDLGVFYDGGYADFKIAAAASYYWNNDTTNFDGSPILSTTNNSDSSNMAASVSLAHSSGFAGTLAYQETGLDNKTPNAGMKDPSTWYAKVGYSWDAFEVAVDYSKAKDYMKMGLNNKDELRTYGLGAQYNLTDGVSLAALYRHFDAKQGGAGVVNANRTVEDIDLYGVNMRVRF